MEKKVKMVAAVCGSCAGLVVKEAVGRFLRINCINSYGSLYKKIGIEAVSIELGAALGKAVYKDFYETCIEYMREVENVRKEA